MMTFLIFLIIIFNFQSSCALGTVPDINVKIGSQVRHLKITSENEFDFHFLRGDYEHKSTQKKLEFDCNFSLSNNKSILFASLVATKKKQDLVYLNKGFGGHIKLSTSKKVGCDVIQSIKMNHYLESLLSKEMNGKWPLEALKAQAVAARSYALDKIEHSIGGNYHIISGEIHQVSGSSEDVTGVTQRAVKETIGEILVGDEGELVPGYYHAECGGETFDPIDVWSGHMFNYKSIKCPYCHEKTRVKYWKKLVSTRQMLEFLKKYYGESIDKIDSVNIINSKKIHLKINKRNYIFLPSDFRKNMLSLKIKSNNFEFKVFKNNNFEILGSGHGHGVGMCQLGALKMAELGFKYKEILKFYYPKLQTKKVYKQ